MRGVKSKEFGCIWKSMFLIALGFPEKFNKLDEKHVEIKKRTSTFLNSVKYALPCKFCREYTIQVIQKKHPLNYAGKRELMFSLYMWKDMVNEKLIAQGCLFTKRSPDFEVIYKYYSGLQASKCDPKKKKCV